ncbi:unnamed protein product [Orchesella dallaii]|uniref:tryptophan--tRNA ligase n=1 Tax=Orchesella dallaii TaxID=48710 RepID=A0ABP1PQG8_9HEXA
MLVKMSLSIKTLVGIGLTSLRHNFKLQRFCSCRQLSSSSFRKFSSSKESGGTGSKKGEEVGEEDVNKIFEESKHEIKGQPRVFSGIQPTGEIHLGNYFGAIRQWVRFQDEKKAGKYEQCIYSVVDLHAITIPQDRDVLEKNIFQAVATLLACGIDPNESILFLQSHVPLHPQLSWVLGCLSTMPQLGRLPNFRDKSKKLKEVPLGLYTYPVLQAADILLYNATHVPVGEDNVQQIQFAQLLAQRFNRIHGRTFNIPKIMLEGGMWCRLRSLRKPENKMSKSEPDAKSRIGLTDSPDEIVEKIKKSVTDFTSAVTYDPETRPGVSNLIMIHSLCSGQSAEEICNSVQDLDTGKYKFVVAEAVVEHLRPIRTKMIELMKEPAYLLDILKIGTEKAITLSEPVWNDVCFKVGISPSHSWLSKSRPDSNDSHVEQQSGIKSASL